jgi:DNA uptake protein ComE-like DNA-binding protein
MNARRPFLLMLPLVLVMACADDPHDQHTAPAAAPDSTAAAPPPAAPTAKLNLNTATREEFLTVPNVGERMVHEFFEYRPYVSIQQFRQEIGKYVSAEEVAAYEQFVFVPITPGQSDAATLQQVPGLDAAEAESLASYRYASNEEFLDRLAPYVTPEALTTARSYLAGQ